MKNKIDFLRSQRMRCSRAENYNNAQWEIFNEKANEKKIVLEFALLVAK